MKIWGDLQCYSEMNSNQMDILQNGDPYSMQEIGHPKTIQNISGTILNSYPTEPSRTWADQS